MRTPALAALLAPALRMVNRAVGHRCPSRHYDAFLQRSVRCRRVVRHADQHRFTTFDETVVWR